MFNLQTLPQKYKTLPQFQNPRKITGMSIARIRYWHIYVSIRVVRPTVPRYALYISTTVLSVPSVTGLVLRGTPTYIRSHIAYRHRVPHLLSVFSFPFLFVILFVLSCRASVLRTSGYDPGLYLFQ